MAFVPSNYRRFLLILVELFIILKIYDVAKESINMQLSTYLVLLFIFLWVFNIILSKIELGKGIPDTLIFRILPRMLFSSDWFGIGVGAAILAGFYFSKFIGSLFLVFCFIVFLGIAAFRLVMNRENILRHSWGLLLLGFVFGVAIGNRFTSNVFIVAVFLIGGLVLYITTTPGEI